MSGVRVLLTEGSSLTAREVVTCLGPCGHHLEVLDPDPMCLARFSRWVRSVHRCPNAGHDPLGYLRRLASVVEQRRIDVVLPTHEQAWLLASAGPLLTAAVPVAVASAAAFARVQSKLEFALLLDELELPQPAWRAVERGSDLHDLPYPYWLKSAFSTAGRGVREVRDARSRDAALGTLSQDGPLMAQSPAPGRYGQVQGLFDRGRLVAVHTSVLRGLGVGGSAAARLSVEHPLPRQHIAKLGNALAWHGGLTLDYFYDGTPRYIECNPRTVEPGNAAASGVNIADLQVRLTRGERLPLTVASGRAAVRTHSTIALLLGSASRGASRRSLLRQLLKALARRSLYADSREQLTPVIRDPPSLASAGFVAARLLLAPAQAEAFAAAAVSSYSIDPAAIAETSRAAAARA